MSVIFSENKPKLWTGLLLLVLVAAGSALVWRWFGDEPGRIGAGFLPEPSPPQEPEGSVLARFGSAPDFSLTERNGRTFSRKELTGKPWVADFIFTSCAGQCPLMSLEMRRLQNLFPKETGMRFVSFTIDPKRDTPEVLSQYADRYGAEKDRWFFLTGPSEEMNRILSGFFLSPVDEPAMHSIRFILVDQEGEMRGYYDSSVPEALKQLVHDTKILTGRK